MNSLSKKEWKVALLIALAILFISHTPLIIGYATQAEDEVFMGVPRFATDTNNHLHMALQAKEGDILLTNKFTGEPVPALLFNPYHLIIGYTAAIFSLNILTAFHIFAILFALIFFIYLYYFLAKFITNKKERLIAYILIGISSGFGAFWMLLRKLIGWSYGSADIWVTDMHAFASLAQPHFMLSLTLLLAIFDLAYQAFEKHSYKHAIYAGVISFLLAAIHLFDIITMAAVLTAWFVIRQIYNKTFSIKEFSFLAIIGTMTLPAVLYYFWVFFFNEAYKSWNSLNQTVTPNIIKIISGFGIVFFLAVYYIYKNKDKFKAFFTPKKQTNKNKNSEKAHRKQTQSLLKETFLLTWLIVQFILIYLPINIQRRLILGLHIPLCIFAAFALVRHTKEFIPKKYINPAITLILLIASVTSLTLTGMQITQLHSETSAEYTNVKYLKTYEVDMLHWVKDNLEDDSEYAPYPIILAEHHISNYIPAITNEKIYSGHWAQTVNFTQKYEVVKQIYSTGTIPKEINPNIIPRQTQATHVIWKKSLPELNEHTLLYENEELAFYKINPIN